MRKGLWNGRNSANDKSLTILTTPRTRGVIANGELNRNGLWRRGTNRDFDSRLRGHRVKQSGLRGSGSGNSTVTPVEGNSCLSGVFVRKGSRR